MKYKKNIRKKKSNLCVSTERIPNDYHWVVLRKFHQDLAQFLTEDENALVSTVIKSRDIQQALRLSEGWDLQRIGTQAAYLPNLRAKLAIAALLKKYRFPEQQANLKAAAYSSFIASEDRCFRYNQYDWKRLAIGKTQKDIEFNTYIQSFIRRVLGDEPELSDFVPWMRHGPGSTTQTEGRKISQYWKFCNWPYHVSSGARKHAIAVISTDDRWIGALQDSYRERFNIPKHFVIDLEHFWSNVLVDCNESKITTVPKNAKTERTIAVEPTLNLYLQLGVDGYIRRKLKRWNIDIDCQAKNQELARRGSKYDSYVTLDLSAASDTISTKLVKQLLPSQWFTYLDNIRSEYGWFNDQLIHYEKFSSMGNGFTFALETLIFAAIVFAAKKIQGQSWNSPPVAIFGDDIIIPKDIADDVVHGLDLCGFKINVDKSFFQGPSRESCGADWWSGYDVRPVFLKEVPKSVKQLFSDRNRLKRLLDLWFSIEESEVCTVIEKWIPTISKKIVGPYSNDEFDTYLHTNESQRYVNQAYVFSRLVSIPNPHKGPTNFLFRKLMVNLSGNNRVCTYPHGHVPGSAFDIFARNDVRNVIVPNSRTEIWCDRYSPRKIVGPSLLGLPV